MVVRMSVWLKRKWCLMAWAVLLSDPQGSVALPMKTTFAQPTTSTATRKKALKLPPKGSLVSNKRFLDKLFDGADLNHDGTINFPELYELVLKMYVQINRQAPIKVPTKTKVLQLYLKYDVSQTETLNREEFRRLAQTLAGRALSRVLAFKIVKFIGAPLLATYIFRRLIGQAWIPATVKAIVPDQWEGKLLPILTSEAFGRTILIVLAVATLGNITLSTVNWLLDLSLEDADKDARLQNYVAKNQ